MQCEEFKQKYNLGPRCCESCHEDDNTGHGEDLWFNVENRDWNICCAVFLNYELRSIEKANKVSKQQSE